MGHKVSPTGFRIGIIEGYKSRWFSKMKNECGSRIVEDAKIRRHLYKECSPAGISKIEIERIGDLIKVILHAARPANIVGRRGSKVNELGEWVNKLSGKRVEIDVAEVRNPATDAQLVSNSIAEQLEKRAPHRRILHKFAEMVMQQANIKGVKIQVKGRLGGAEIARKEQLCLGKIPLQTLRAVIDYATSTAHLTKGTIGVKVWIYKGELIIDPKTGEKRIIG
jgi:small subunit ribosomal protein S3